MDRVNKKLAGAGPYQDAIIGRARKIHGIFRAAGEGFSSSLEGAVDAVQSLEKQLGMIGSVSGNLVKLMSTIKLSINLSNDVYTGQKDSQKPSKSLRRLTVIS